MTGADPALFTEIKSQAMLVEVQSGHLEVRGG
jgi:hypothetical protein